MLGSGWQAVRQAQDALRHGRLEEAERLLGDPAVAGRRGSHQVYQRLVQGYVERAERSLRADDVSAAWQDLERGERHGLDRLTTKLRQTLTRLGLAQVRAALEAGKPGQASDMIAELREHGVRQPELSTMEEAASHWARAQQLADLGEFAQATRMVSTIRRVLHESGGAFEKFCMSLSERAEAVAALLLDLHAAAGGHHWRLVLQLTEQILALAPHQSEARRFRQEAWRALEPDTIVESTKSKVASHVTVDPSEGIDKYLLWIDGVGGYLVCLGNQVSFGQAVPGNRVDVPIFADVSRRHATLRRDSEGYTLDALRSSLVNGNRVEQKSLLRDGDRVTFGTSCQMIFQQSVPLSASARLELVSGHRLKVAVDGILLMADTILIGPGVQSHVNVPDLGETLILFRHKNSIGIRSPSGRLRMNGESQGERCIVSSGAIVAGEDFSFTLEAVRGQL